MVRKVTWSTCDGRKPISPRQRRDVDFYSASCKVSFDKDPGKFIGASASANGDRAGH